MKLNIHLLVIATIVAAWAGTSHEASAMAVKVETQEVPTVSATDVFSVQSVNTCMATSDADAMDTLLELLAKGNCCICGDKTWWKWQYCNCLKNQCDGQGGCDCGTDADGDCYCQCGDGTACIDDNVLKDLTKANGEQLVAGQAAAAPVTLYSS